MAGRRIVYLASLIGCLAFYYFYREWLSWLFLMAIIALPWFSLLLSLPALLTAKATLAIPGILSPKETCRAQMDVTAIIPPPPFAYKLRVSHAITGEVRTLKPGQHLPTDVCGRLEIRQAKAWICDYLGLFRFPLRKKDDLFVYVRPNAEPIVPTPDFAVLPPRQWKPKPGGGFAENHELRLYRPGDNLQQIHWKLSAKTGNLILREAMDPIHQPLRLTLDLCGTAEELNRKLGQLLWLGNLLVEKGRIFDIAALTGRGVLTRRIAAPEDLKKAMTALLSAPAAENGTMEDRPLLFGKTFHIGGEPDEP